MAVGRQHYWIVTGNIVFVGEVDKTQAFGEATLNALISDPKQQIGVRMLARAQQSVQMHWRQKTNDLKSKVLDVVIMNISYLGHMTETEFNQPAEDDKKSILEIGSTEQ